jgi:hypothetical protein
LMHPTLFADAMRNARSIHTGFVHQTRDWQAMRSAQSMAKSLDAMENLLRRTGRIDPRKLEFGAKIQAFSIAARLQCVSPDLQADIASRH